MTKQERLLAMEMRLEGKTWAQIAAAVGYAPATVKQDITACILRAPRQVNCVYPALKYIIVNDYGGSVYAFAQACGVSPNAMYYVLPGAREPGRKVAMAIQKATGLSYEEAFYREV